MLYKKIHIPQETFKILNLKIKLLINKSKIVYI